MKTKLILTGVMVCAAFSHGAAQGWRSPDSHYDPNNKWSNETQAYDGNTGTFARDDSRVRNGWGRLIVFTLNTPILADKVRVFSEFPAAATQVRVEIQLAPADTWQTVHTGPINGMTWHEIPFTATNISAARYQFYYTARYQAQLYEFEFHQKVGPPACETRAASDVGNTNAVLNGFLNSDGGETCQYRFEYGTSTNYSTNTAWAGSLSSNNTFSAMLSGLQTNTRYHCRAQTRNAAGANSGSNVTFRTGPPYVGWKSPDGHIDTNNRWIDEIRAYDTNTSTYASDQSGVTGWGSPLTLTLNEPVKSDRVRVFSDYAAGVDRVRVEIQLSPSGAWSNVYEGAVDNQAWHEVPFATTNISAARYTFRYTSAYYFWLYEFEFYVLPDLIAIPECETQSATSVEETTAILHGAVANDGGQPCEYRFQYGLTEAYTTNTPWAGSLVAGELFSRILTGLESNTTYNFRAQARNSSGTASGSNQTFITGPPPTGWVTPTGWSDASGEWRHVDNVMDDNVDSVAKCYHDINDPAWSPYLYLTHAVMQCEAIRFYARKTDEITSSEVDVLRNGVWSNVHTGTFPDRQWVEAAFPRGTVTQARVRFQMGTSYGMDWELNEFDFHRVMGVTLSGAYDGARPVTLAVDGVTRATFNNFTTNVFSFNVSLGAGSRILLYYNDDNIATNTGAIVTRATGADMSGLDLEANTLILRSDHGGQLLNTDLATAGNGDADLPFRVTGANVFVTNHITMKVPAGHAFALAANTNSLNLRHHLSVDGVLDNTAGTMIFAGVSTVSGAAAPAFNNVLITGSLTAPAGPMRVAGNWANNGVFNHNNGLLVFDGTTTLGGTRTNTFRHVSVSGTLTAPAGILNLAGNFTNNGAFNHNNGTVVFTGAASVSGSAATTFRNVTIPAGGSLTAPAAGSLYIEGNWNKANTGAFNHNNGAIVFVGAGSSTSFGSTVFYDLQCVIPGKQLTFQNGTTQQALNTLNLAGEPASRILLRSSTAGAKWTIAFPNGPQAVTYVDVRDSNATNNIVSVAGGVNSGNNNTNWVFLQNRYWVGGAGNWNNTARWSLASGGAGGATVPDADQMAIFDANSGSGTCALNGAAAARGLVLNANTPMTLSAGAHAMDVGVGGVEQHGGTFIGGTNTLDVAGTFKLTAGQFTAPAGLLRLGGDVTHSGGAFSHNNGTVELTGACVMDCAVAHPLRHLRITGSLLAPMTLRLTGNLENNGSFEHNNGAVRFEGDTAIAGSSVTLFNNTHIAGTLQAHSNLMRVAGLWTNDGVFQASGGTVAFAGNTFLTGTRTSAFHHVRIDGTLTPAAHLPLLVAGNWTNNGAFNHNEGLVVFNGTSLVGGANATYFRDVRVDGDLTLPSAPVYIAGNLQLNRAFNHGGGTMVFNGDSAISGTATAAFHDITIWNTLTARAGLMRVAGNWVNDGAFNHNNGTVRFDGNSQVLGGYVTTFRNLENTGQLTGHAAQMRVAGNWTGVIGEFFHNNGAVVMAGTNAQTVASGGAFNGALYNWKNNWSSLIISNTAAAGVTFNDGFKAARFTCAAPNARLFFRADMASNEYDITASGGLNIQGAAGQLVRLRGHGGAAGDQWNIVPSTPDGVWAVSYVDVADSANTASNAIFPSASTDSGNNDNWFTVTCVRMTEFTAGGWDSQVVARWRTGSEYNNAGFHLHRSLTPTGGFERINANLIPGLGSSTRGRAYRFDDFNVTNDVLYYYKLEAIEYDGRGDFHGPVSAMPNAAAGTPPDDDEPAGGEPGAAGGWTPTPGDAGIYRLTVATAGVCRITGVYLRDTAGVTNLTDWDMAGVRLYNRGVEIPLRVYDAGGPGFATNSFVEFYGVGMTGRFTSVNVYWLCPTTNAGRRMTAGGIAGGALTTTIRHTAHYEENAWYQDEMPDEAPDDDHWFFDQIFIAPGAGTNQVVLDDAAAVDATATLRVALRAINYDSPHHVRARLNGVDLADGYWSGMGQYVHTAAIAQSNLIAGANELVLTFPNDVADFEHVLLNWIEVDYQRDLNAADDACAFRSDTADARAYQIAGFTDPDIQVLRITAAGTPSIETLSVGAQFATNVVLITNAMVAGAGPYTVRFEDVAPSGTLYLAVAAPGRLTPADAREGVFYDLRNPTNGADYILIAHDAFLDEAAPLAAHRAAQGRRARVVGLQSVYDDFGFGLPTPYAIRDFLAYARAHWAPPAPVYVVLAGDATYDYQDYEQTGVMNFMPVKMLHSEPMIETPSDHWYVAHDGTNDLTGAMFIGRLPARSPEELTALIDKIIAYEAAGADDDWARTVMLAANEDEQRFSEMSERIRMLMPSGLLTNRVYRAEYPSGAACSNAIVAGFNQGAWLVNYAGHGITHLWGKGGGVNEPLFTTDTAATLANEFRLPFVVTPTCLNGYFVYPDYESLAEELIRNENGGAVACFSPAGMSSPPEQEAMVTNLFHAILNEGMRETGRAVNYARTRVLAELDGVGRNVAESFILLGDPAMPLKSPGGIPPGAAPAVLDAAPPTGMTNVFASTNITVRFNRPMDEVATRAAFVITPAAAGAFYWDDANQTLIFRPAANLSFDTTYTVQIFSNACDLAGRGLTNDFVWSFRTGRTVAPDLGDTDGDGLNNWDEPHVYGTDPLNPDTDGDGLSDGAEALVYCTNPLLADTDGDGYADGVELDAGTDPLDPHSYPRGALRIDVHPTNAAWRITAHPPAYTGVVNGIGSLPPTVVPAGAYTVEYQPLPLYSAPPPQTLHTATNVPHSALYSGARAAVGAAPAPAVVTEFSGLYNQWPVIAGAPALLVEMSRNGIPTNFALTLHASDPEGDPLAWSLRAQAVNGAAAADGAGETLAVTYNPQLNFTGNDIFRVRATDPHGGYDEVSVQVAVHAWIPPGPYPSFTAMLAPGSAARRGALLKTTWQGRYPLELVDIDLLRSGAASVPLARNMAAPDAAMDFVTRLPDAARVGELCAILARAAHNPDDFAVSGSFKILPAAPCDFDGDGLSDPVIWRAHDGHWRVLLSGSAWQSVEFRFGDAACAALPDDYDGDGMADPAVYCATTGLWRALASGAAYCGISARLGMPEAMPVPADYDGDGFTDPAVYLPQAVPPEDAGAWRALLSRHDYSPGQLALGGGGQHPVPNDYDGDGLADPCVYEAAAGQWRIMLSGSGYTLLSIALGASGWQAVPGDYDGDGLADPCVYHPDTGTWLARVSSQNHEFCRLVMGEPGCVWVAGDYDGDGRADPAVYEIATGVWRVRLSSADYAEQRLPFGDLDYRPAAGAR